MFEDTIKTVLMLHKARVDTRNNSFLLLLWKIFCINWNWRHLQHFSAKMNTETILINIHRQTLSLCCLSKNLKQTYHPCLEFSIMTSSQLNLTGQFSSSDPSEQSETPLHMNWESMHTLLLHKKP